MLGEQKLEINKMVYENLKIINTELLDIETSIEKKIINIENQAKNSAKLLKESQSYFRTIMGNLSN